MDFAEVPDKHIQGTETAESARRQPEQIDEAGLASTLQHIVGQLDVLTQVCNTFRSLYETLNRVINLLHFIPLFVDRAGIKRNYYLRLFLEMDALKWNIPKDILNRFFFDVS